MDDQKGRIRYGENKGRKRSFLFAATMHMKEKVGKQMDGKPMLDKRAPISIGGINNAARLCDSLSIPLVFS